MSPIQFQVVDAFIKWMRNRFKGKFDDYINKDNEVRQAWVGFAYVLSLFFILLILAKLLKVFD